MSVCADCGAAENLQEHHLSYVPDVTEYLCVRCHQDVHSGHGVGVGRGTRRGIQVIPPDEPYVGYRRVVKQGGSHYISLPPGWMYHNCISKGITELLCIFADDIRIVNPEDETQVVSDLLERLRDIPIISS